MEEDTSFLWRKAPHLYGGRHLISMEEGREGRGRHLISMEEGRGRHLISMKEGREGRGRHLISMEEIQISMQEVKNYYGGTHFT